MKQRIDVMALALDLFEQDVIRSQPDVATGRKRFWANFGPKEPMQIIVTDGELHLHVEPKRIGVVEYEVVGDPTYVLIVEHDEPNGQWVIVYAYFFKKHVLRTGKLKHEIRLFNSVNLSPEKLEALLNNIPHHD